MVRFYKMAKYVFFMANAIKKMAKFFEIGHEMANLATLLQRQVAKLASGLLYSWSLLRNNNTAINLQMFTSSCGSSRFVTCDQDSH